MIIAVPAPTPVTTPVVFIVAIGLLLLLHIPPVMASVNCIVLPAHTGVLPVMIAIGLTVATVVITQPVGRV